MNNRMGNEIAEGSISNCQKNDGDDNENQFLTLSLSPPAPSVQDLFSNVPPSLPLQLEPCHPIFIPNDGVSRPRRGPAHTSRQAKSDVVPAPFPWATTHRATVHTLCHLLSHQIHTIRGAVQCKRCEKQFEIGYDLQQKFFEIGTFILENKAAMRERAPSEWLNPTLPNCRFCGQENGAKPVMAEKKRMINWLFLLLGQMLGCCTLEQLKYFCKHTKNHRTGAKDRVLYLTYLGLCKQLHPDGTFDR